MTENARIEYKLEINIPELGSKDELNVAIDLDSRPGLSSIIGNFYRFLIRIGIDQDILDAYIDIPDDDDLDEDDDIDWENAASSVISDIEETILNNSTDEKKKEDFVKKIQENPDFLEEVFRTFLSSLMQDDEDEV